MLAHPGTGELENIIRCRSRFLHEAFDDHEAILLLKEHDANDAVSLERAPDLEKTVAEWPAKRHTQRPAQLNGPQIFADDTPVIGRHAP